MNHPVYTGRGDATIALLPTKMVSRMAGPRSFTRPVWSVPVPGGFPTNRRQSHGEYLGEQVSTRRPPFVLDECAGLEVYAEKVVKPPTPTARKGRRYRG